MHIVFYSVICKRLWILCCLSIDRQVLIFVPVKYLLKQDTTEKRTSDVRRHFKMFVEAAGTNGLKEHEL